MKRTKKAHYDSQSLHIHQYFLNLSNDRAYHSSVKFFTRRLLQACSIKSFEKYGNPQEGTIRFITMVTNWFKMMNVKDKFGTINLRDPFRAPWTLNCENFDKPLAMCDVIGSCRWEGGKYRQKKLTKFTADAFIVTTKFSVAAATYLLTHHQFEFVLPAVFSQDPLEKFFGQAKRHVGNFYIDVGDVISACKAQRLH